MMVLSVCSRHAVRLVTPCVPGKVSAPVIDDLSGHSLVESRPAGDASYGVISNTVPWVVVPFPKVVP